MVLPTPASSFVAYLADGIQMETGESDHRVLLGHTRHDPEIETRQIELLLQHKVDGVIVVTGERTLPKLPERLNVLEQARVP